MKGLRNKFERFCYKNQKIGIPGLMLFVTIGTAMVYLLKQFNMPGLAELLYFDRNAILRGQVWRLLTYIFTYDSGNPLKMILGFICFLSLGRSMERAWGTLRFNLFYFTGVLLMDVFCMIFGGEANVFALNMSLLISWATMYSEDRFYLFFIIPMRGWIIAIIYLGLTLQSVIFSALGGDYLSSLFHLVALGNYFLFFGRDVVNVLPPAWRSRLTQKRTQSRQTPPRQAKTVPFPGTAQHEKAASKTPYTHRCVVCGRTDVSHPDLEFRYCSRCKGYFCYCEDHISNHNHVE